MTNSSPPLTRGARLIGALMKNAPNVSIANMTADQIEAAQSGAPAGPLVTAFTSVLLGGVERGVAVSERVIDGPDGDLRLRVYSPERAAGSPRPLILYFHGGGWVLGSPEASDWLCSTVARDADAVVASVDYRLAPRHKFPAGLEDCYAATVWGSQEAASLGADPGRIGVMGDSAGGNLAAVVCLLARERGGPAIGHQALLYPVTDGSQSSDSYRANAEAIILTAADMRAFYGHYLGPDDDPLSWRVSPLHAPDLSGLPPAVVVTAGHDPLHNEGVAYARRLEQAGVPVTLHDYPAMPHGFLSFPRFSRDAGPAMAAVVRSQQTL
jgi:acetyl esterase